MLSSCKALQLGVLKLASSRLRPANQAGSATALEMQARLRSRTLIQQVQCQAPYGASLLGL